MANAKAELGIMSCSQCQKLNLAIKVCQAFDLSCCTNQIKSYNSDTQEMIMNESDFIRMIQLINQGTPIKKICLEGGETN